MWRGKMITGAYRKVSTKLFRYAATSLGVKTPVNQLLAPDYSHCWLLLSSMNTSRKPRVVVVGAGASGLSAAARLASHNIRDIVVLEGRDRVGGRISTLNIGNRRIDEGATWIHGTEGNPLSELAKQTGSALQEWVYGKRVERSVFYRESGGKVTPHEAELAVNAYKTHLKIMERLDFPVEEYRKQIKTNRPTNLYQYLRENWEETILRGHNEDERRFLKSVLRLCYQKECQDAGVGDLTNCSLTSFAEYQSLDGHDAVFPNGYSEILEPMLREIPKDAIRLNSAVERVEWSPSGCCSNRRRSPLRVVFSCAASGRTESVEADHVIVTVPVGCLRDFGSVLFKPPLPDDKIDACKRLGFNTVNKIALLYNKPFWSRDQTTVSLLWDDVTEKHWTRDVIELHAKERGNDCWLETWLCGESADEIEKLSSDEVGWKCTEMFRKFVGPHVPDPVSTHVTRWGGDRFSRGSYVCLTSESCGDDIDTLAEPLPGNKRRPQVLFAGEGTSRNYFGTVHGAIWSGQREADRLLRHYRLSSNGEGGCNGLDARTIKL